MVPNSPTMSAAIGYMPALGEGDTDRSGIYEAWPVTTAAARCSTRTLTASAVFCETLPSRMLRRLLSAPTNWIVRRPFFSFEMLAIGYSPCLDSFSFFGGRVPAEESLHADSRPADLCRSIHTARSCGS